MFLIGFNMYRRHGIFKIPFSMFLGATKHLYNWLCPLVDRSVERSVGRVTQSFNDPHVAPYQPTWPGFLSQRLPANSDFRGRTCR